MFFTAVDVVAYYVIFKFNLALKKAKIEMQQYIGELYI